MNTPHVLSAQYPIEGTNDCLEITVGIPALMPPLTRQELEESLGDHSLSEEELNDWVDQANKDNTSKKVTWKITAPDFEHEGYSCGSDDLQAMLLALQSIDLEITKWEHESHKKCTYTFTIATKIITQLPEEIMGGKALRRS